MAERNGRCVALVTGASSGIGVHYAGELARRGYNVILVSNQSREVRDVAARIAQSTGATDCSHIVETDMDHAEIVRLTAELPHGSQWVVGVYKNLAMTDAAEKLFEFYPQVDVLVNNAGIFFFNDIVDCSISRIETMLNLHVMTVTKLCRLYAGQMCGSGRGYILNMSSISVHTPFPGIALYTATKSFIRTFSKALRGEVKECGVGVTVVSPGAVATDLYSLPPNLQKLGIRLGVIYRPERLARKALNGLFKGKKEFVPGAINHLFRPIYALIPPCTKIWVRRKTKFMMK